jgi:hypothetical protein
VVFLENSNKIIFNKNTDKRGNRKSITKIAIAFGQFMAIIV